MKPHPSDSITDTRDAAYADRLVRIQSKWWKKLLPVQLPYKWNVMRLNLGFTLDLGCGTGRSLLNLRGNGVGIDHNLHSIAISREKGLKAYTPEEFATSAYNVPNRFDSIMLAHVAEHLRPEEAEALIRSNLPVLKPNGKLLLLTPQERGFKSDASHVTYMDFGRSADLARACGFDVVKQYSFPFPRSFGNLFIYNEFVTLGRLRAVQVA